jgi:hypothetical protein
MASFTYLDRNSRQSDDCISYNTTDPCLDDRTSGPTTSASQCDFLSYCWVLGTYNGVTGWLPVQRSRIGWTSALCTFQVAAASGDQPQLLVSDNGSGTGCAELTVGEACFPADAVVTLRSGATVSLARLEVGDEVAVRAADGSLAYEAVYAFGHRDAQADGHFVELTAVATTASGAAVQHKIQVGAAASRILVAGVCVTDIALPLNAGSHLEPCCMDAAYRHDGVWHNATAKNHHHVCAKQHHVLVRCFGSQGLVTKHTFL